eukprot:scaffold87716_cov51-Phaeocystis_antarctica.AAC.2
MQMWMQMWMQMQMWMRCRCSGSRCVAKGKYIGDGLEPCVRGACYLLLPAACCLLTTDCLQRLPPTADYSLTY